METKKNVRHRIALCGWLAAAALCCLPVAHAKGGYGPVVSPASNGFNIKYATNGTPMAVPANTSTGVSLAIPATVNLGPLAAAQVVTSAAIAGGQIGGPWGAAVGAVGIAAVLALPALADAYARAKIRANPVTGVLERADPAVCTVAPCYEYRINGAYGDTGWVGDRESAAQAYAVKANAYFKANGLPTWNMSVSSCSGGRGTPCMFVLNGSSSRMDPAEQGAAPKAVAYVPATLAQAQAAISAINPTWDQVQALVDLGFPPDPGPITITGPATVADTNTTSLGLDGSRKDETCKFYLEYFPSNIKAHPECTVTTTTPEKTETRTVTETGPDGLPVTKTITTVTPAKTETTTVVKDKLPQDTRTDCEKFPNSVGCQELDSPDGEIPKSTKNVTFTPENLGFGGGACPANIVQSIHGQSVTVFSYTKPCEIIRTYVAPLVLAISAFVAFMILTPGGRPE